MGNVQTLSIGSQIYPSESYVQDVDNLFYNRRFVKLTLSKINKFDFSLGDTRFMKTACVECKDGLSVVKLFVLNEDFKQFDLYINLVKQIRKKLKDASNCLPFTQRFVSQ